MKTQVIGCPKTIDGDLKCKEVPISFGFDTACKVIVILLGGVFIALIFIFYDAKSGYTILFIFCSL